MKVVIVSDTHGNVANFKKVVAWVKGEHIGLILHCGDIGSPESLEESLTDFGGQLFGVLGNMDRDYNILIGEYNKINKVRIESYILEVEIDKKQVAITHYPEKAKELAGTRNPSRPSGQEYDLVFYGHTHKPWEEKMGNCRLINPGEIAGQIYKPAFAVYNTENDVLELKILEKL